MNSLAPEISIVSSLWRERDDLFRKCIESVINQTHKNFEWIVVDDGASESNLKLLMSYQDSRIKIIKNLRNIGLTASLNKAIAASTGQYIARMDTDDYCMPERLKKQFEFMRESPEYVLCGCFYEEEKNGVRIKSSVKELSSNLEILENISTFNPIAHPTWFFRKDVFCKLGGYDESFRYAQDYELLTRFIKFGKVTNLSQILFVRTVNADRISTKLNREQLLYSLQIRMRLIFVSDNKISSFYSILKSSLKFLFHPLFNKDTKL